MKQINITNIDDIISRWERGTPVLVPLLSAVLVPHLLTIQMEKIKDLDNILQLLLTSLVMEIY